MQKVVLKPGREKALLRRHPWIFSGALYENTDAIDNGETVDVVSSDGTVLARGAYSPRSQIRIRLWTFNTSEVIDAGFFKRRIERAVTLRRTMIPSSDNAYRLINAESDGLPGLIVDQYAEFTVCQFLSAGMEYHKQEILEQLQEILSPAGIYERSDVEIREKEGLKPRSGLLTGKEPPEFIEVKQGRIHFLVDIRHGHKTGMYLDQRDNRCLVETLAGGREVLNCFAYTGGFALASLRGNAKHVTNIESSADALDIFLKQANRNNICAGKYENIKGDVFSVLRLFHEEQRKFDMVILDPPKFVSNAQQLKRGCRGYKDINRLAFELLRKNGLLVTFSCSGHLPVDLFQKIVADAAVDANCEAKIIANPGQPADHPVALNFPEGRYLKGLVCCT